MSKLIKNGESFMVTIPQAICKKLSWTEQTEVLINLDTISGKVIIEKL